MFERGFCIHWAVLVRMNPAFNVWCYFIIYTITIYCVIRCNDTFRKSRNSYKRFESRTGSNFGLGCPVYKRSWFVIQQFIVIIGVNGTWKIVNIITWITYHSKNWSTVRIFNNTWTWTRIKCKLRRSYVKIGYFSFKEVKCWTTVCDIYIFTLCIFNSSLFHKYQAYFTTW